MMTRDRVLQILNHALSIESVPGPGNIQRIEGIGNATELILRETYRPTINDGADLKQLTEDFVDRQFNYIQVNVLEKMCDGMLFEYISHDDPDYDEFLNNYDLWVEYNEYVLENELDGEDDDIKKEWCKEQSNFDDWRMERENEDYPMWNTCFEWKENPTVEMLNAAREAGFGVIEGLDDFNTILFVSGCGYSFYGHHWIPLFINMPWNSHIKKQVEEKNIYFRNQ